MRTEPTKWFEPLQKLRSRMAPSTGIRPLLLIADRSKAVVMLWFSDLFFILFRLLSSHLLGKAAHSIDHMFSLYYFFVCLVNSRFGF